MTIKLSNKSLRGDHPTACWELLGVIALPDFDLCDINIREACTLEKVLKRETIVVARVGIAHEHVLFSTKENLEPCDPVLGKVGTTHIGLKLC